MNSSPCADFEAARPPYCIFSLSWNQATPAMAKQVSSLVNMYRVTADDWDRWDHVAAHFDVSRYTTIAQYKEVALQIVT